MDSKFEVGNLYEIRTRNAFFQKVGEAVHTDLGGSVAKLKFDDDSRTYYYSFNEVVLFNQTRPDSLPPELAELHRDVAERKARIDAMMNRSRVYRNRVAVVEEVAPQSPAFYIDVVMEDGSSKRISIVLPKKVSSITIVRENHTTYPWEDDDPDYDGVFIRR